jgi:hypothetical protein
MEWSLHVWRGSVEIQTDTHTHYIYIIFLYFSKMVSVTFCSVLFCSVLSCSVQSSIGGQTAVPIGLKSAQVRVRIDARASRANMRAAPHIQYRRPHDRAYRAPNWNKHSLGQWVELMGVGDPECALIRALRAQICAQNHISSIDGQTTGPIEPQIGTNTHSDNG